MPTKVYRYTYKLEVAGLRAIGPDIEIDLRDRRYGPMSGLDAPSLVSSTLVVPRDTIAEKIYVGREVRVSIEIDGESFEVPVSQTREGPA